MARCLGLALVVALLAAAPVLAEEIGTDTGGLHPGRSYFSAEPWELFDGDTGNLSLVFTDITLPGNGGRALRVQRTYSCSARAGSWRSAGSPRSSSRPACRLAPPLTGRRTSGWRPADRR